MHRTTDEKTPANIFNKLLQINLHLFNSPWQNYNTI